MTSERSSPSKVSVRSNCSSAASVRSSRSYASSHVSAKDNGSQIKRPALKSNKPLSLTRCNQRNGSTTDGTTLSSSKDVAQGPQPRKPSCFGGMLQRVGTSCSGLCSASAASPDRRRFGFKDIFSGAGRAAVFVKEVFPIMLHYKWVQLRGRTFRWDEEESNQAFHELDLEYAPQALEICLKMQGFYIKIGQMTAGGGLGVMPQEYVDRLNPLLEDCPSLSFDIVKRIVEEDLGPIQSVFQSFDRAPIHGASIGQVHCATLIGGRGVVVKIQYPSAENNFHVDIACWLTAVKLLAPQHSDLLVEIKKNFVNEFDYKREAALTQEAHDLVKSLTSVVVPIPVIALCGKHVLVMEKLEGISLGAWGRELLKHVDKLKELKEVMDHAGIQTKLAYAMKGFFSSKPRSKPSSPANARLKSLQFGNKDADPRNLQADIGTLAKTLVAAQGHMIFTSGFVNGDPHPGNLMLLNDGRLGLIDWGQVKRLTAELRCNFARLCIAIADGDDVQTAQVMRSMGMRTARDL
ncbi:unnamed protein product, partial [Polarella glacialis]